MNDVTLELTREQADYLLELLVSTEDSGPHYEGWRSEKLIEVTDIVRAQIDEAVQEDADA